ncbi:MAG: SUMF1/EgtB/PvdO family nonheme iron enzyme [Hyphomonadaceae bacterium]
MADKKQPEQDAQPAQAPDRPQPAKTEDRGVRLASIVSIDIVGFSAMSERDQRGAARKVEKLRERIIKVAAKHGGRLFNTAGDGFMLEFGSAGAALGAIQELLDRRPYGEPPIRIGAHVGDVIATATDDLLGHGVNVAARLQELAEPGTALVSAEFRSMARTSPTGAFQAKGQRPLENIEQRVQTFEILSTRQRIARFTRKAGFGLVGAGAVGAAVYFSPLAWNTLQGMLPERTAPAETQPQVQSAADLDVASGPSTPAYTPGHTFSDCENCPEVVVLPGGLFTMGSPDDEPGRGADEGPRREVSVAPFAIGKNEVTFAQWDACLAGGGCNGYSPPDHGWGRGARPVTDVSWEDAQAYLDWLNSRVGGQRYRLATEAEWEYAARAGARDAYAFGADLAPAQATFAAQRTTPVAQHQANAFALFDMHGNVGEWVEDCYVPNYEQAPIEGAVAVQRENCTARVFRGGGFSDAAPVLRAAARQSAPATQRSPAIGFRVARALD